MRQLWAPVGLATGCRSLSIARNTRAKYQELAEEFQIYVMQANMPVLTEAHCIAAKVIVNLSFDHLHHRDTGLLDLNKFAPIEVAVALIYCEQRTCAGRHKDCDCRCCSIQQIEGVATCFECRKHLLVADLIREFDTGEEIPKILASWVLQELFPRKYRPAASVAAKPKAKGSHFNFSFDK